MRVPVSEYAYGTKGEDTRDSVSKSDSDHRETDADDEQDDSSDEDSDSQHHPYYDGDPYLKCKNFSCPDERFVAKESQWPREGKCLVCPNCRMLYGYGQRSGTYPDMLSPEEAQDHEWEQQTSGGVTLVESETRSEGRGEDEESIEDGQSTRDIESTDGDKSYDEQGSSDDEEYGGDQ
jgi:hypothetical protein